MTIARYRPKLGERTQGTKYVYMAKVDDGEWVKLSDVAALPDPVEVRGGAEPVAWLIERPSTKGGQPRWWRTLVKGRPATIHVIDATNDNEWTTDANEAVRFARKEDAETVIKALDLPPSLMRATEHVWMSPVPVPTSEPGAIRPLNWQKRNFKDDLIRAETVVGTYRVWTHDEANGQWFWSLGYGNVTDNHPAVADCEAGKTAAQADFNAKINSVLVTPSPAAIEAAAKVGP